ncbi:Wall-associated receptor kinase 3 [Bienertia sinuspersici]
MCSSSSSVLEIHANNKKKLTSKEKERNFIKNGAALLEMQIAYFEGKCKEPIKIYSEKDIDRAINGYDPAIIIGRRFTTVYRGDLEGRAVALTVFQCFRGSGGTIEFFSNHFTIKQPICHQNAVELYGCCLETLIPMVVHELMDVSKPVVHRDVVSSNIFLDKSFSAKLSNFGFSITINPEDMMQTWPIIGTIGYIDSEYLKTSLVTEKCDVYSFGVVMLELLTGQYPAKMQKEGDGIAEYFSSHMIRNSVEELVDQRLLQEESVKATMQSFAELTAQCVEGPGGRRPTMEEVVSKMVKSCYMCSSSSLIVPEISTNNEKKLTSKAKEKNIIHNGVLLGMQIAYFEGKCKEPIKIYLEEDIDHATNGYDHAMIISPKSNTGETLKIELLRLRTRVSWLRRNVVLMMPANVFQMVKSCYMGSSSSLNVLEIPANNKKKLTSKDKERNFIINGAILLEMQIASFDGKCKEPIKIYSEEDIGRATNGYDPAMIIGHNLSMVYRGDLEDRAVAIKNFQGRHGSGGMVEFFLNQVTIKQQISHQNVVQLYGCCLETHIPMLVHELMDGCLSDFLHESNGCWLSWQNRLIIAIGVAYALSYMHSAGSKPIVHRDVKSSSIFLDKSLFAKLSNFGLSITIDPEDMTESLPINGTIGYIDPEYIITSLVTEKCDVYSFGVVMLELLTGKYPPKMQGDDIVQYFSSHMTQNSVEEIVDQKLLQEESVKTTLQPFAELIAACVQCPGERRPTMEEVVLKLQEMKKLLNC